MKNIIEGSYEIMVNDVNEVLIAVKSKKTEPKSPRILYDGGDHAIFYRNESETVLLDFIHPDAKNFLFQTKSVLIGEVDDRKGIKRAYDVPVKQVIKLPLSGSFVNFSNKMVETYTR